MYTLARRGHQTWVSDINENGINENWTENKVTSVLPFHPLGLSL
jgi:hypothetical protein